MSDVRVCVKGECVEGGGKGDGCVWVREGCGVRGGGVGCECVGGGTGEGVCVFTRIFLVYVCVCVHV